jgi:hypothetical protein
MKRLAPKALLDTSRFEMIAVLTGDERFAFLRHYFWNVPSAVTRTHHLCSMGMVASVVISAASDQLGIVAWLSGIAVGAGAAIVVGVPLHEAIHGLAYRALGARDIRWTVSIRARIATVSAHRFVVSRPEVMFVAASPWVVITGLLCVASARTPWLRPAVMTAMMMNHFASRGDWAYLSYFWRTRGRAIYAFEDVEAQKSWFFASKAELLVDVDSSKTEQ